MNSNEAISKATQSWTEADEQDARQRSSVVAWAVYGATPAPDKVALKDALLLVAYEEIRAAVIAERAANMTKPRCWWCQQLCTGAYIPGVLSRPGSRMPKERVPAHPECVKKAQDEERERDPNPQRLEIRRP